MFEKMLLLLLLRDVALMSLYVGCIVVDRLLESVVAAVATIVIVVFIVVVVVVVCFLFSFSRMIDNNENVETCHSLIAHH